MTKIKKIQSATQAYQYPLLIKRLLAESLKFQPTNEIYYRDIFKMNYIELNQRVRRMANVLNQLGLEGGQTVGFIDYDSHRFFENFFATPMTGNVLHTINWRLAEQQILYTINHAADDLLIIQEDFLPLIDSIWAQVETVKKIIVCTDKGTSLEEMKTKVSPAMATLIIGEYETLTAAASDEYEFPDFDENAMATTFYTTGTTGNPKGVYFSHRQLVLHTLIDGMMYGGVLQNAFSNFNSSATFLGLTPFFHVHGWGFPYYATMIGAKQVYAGRFSIEYFAQLFKKHNPTLTTGVPSILQMFLNSELTKDFDFSKMKMLIGGSALLPKLAKEAYERGIDILSGYGMSEAAPMLTNSYLDPVKSANWDLEEQIKYRIIAGKPVFLAEVKIIDPDGNALPKDGNHVGEIVARTPWLTQGYYNEPEKSEQLWEGGWMHTGDLATIDKEGYVRITDRLKDVIKTGGEWISSTDLERIICQHPAIAEIAVVGMPDEKWGERPYAMVTVEEGSTITVTDLKTFLQPYIENGTINKWAVPSSILPQKELPKTSVGKVDKKQIRKIMAEVLINE